MRVARALLVLVVIGSGLVLAPVAGASSSFTWSGKASSALPGWSQAANWEGGLGPLASSTVSLVFPKLGGSCEVATPSESCYLSNADVNGLTVESVHIDDGGFYEVFGSQPVTLGAGGLTAEPEGSAPGYAEVSMPITLGASQTWNLSGTSREEVTHNLFILEDELNGSSSALTLEVSKGLGLLIGANVQVGALSIDGAEATGPKIKNAAVGLGRGGTLNSVDGEPVNLSHLYFFGSGQLGALHTNATTFVVGNGTVTPGKLEATSATLDPETTAIFEISGSSLTPGVGYSQLTSHGPVNLGSALLVILVPKLSGHACPVLVPGQTFTLVSTTGALSGEFSDAPESHEIPIEFLKECNKPSQTMQISYHESGGTQTVTGTVEAARKKQEEKEAEEAAKRKQEEEAAATKKHQEEEAAARKRQEEEAAAARKRQEEELAAAKKHQEEELAAASVKHHQEEEAIAAANKRQQEEATKTGVLGAKEETPKSKPLTRAQKLAKALKQCKKQPKKKRASCIVKAEKLYGHAKPKKHGKK